MTQTNDFSIEEVDGTIVITPGPRIGSLDNAYLAERRTALVDAIRQTSDSAVVVDFSRVGYFGSLLLDTLCVVWKQARERSGTMALCSLSDVSKEILNKSRLNSLWPVFSSRQEAIDAVRNARSARPADSTDDSTITEYLPSGSSSRFQIRSSGERTVVGFAGGELPSEYVLSRYLTELTNLVAQRKCREFVFDMAGVSSVPSGFLGAITSILNKGVKISVANPSTEIREVLALTNLDQRVHYESGE
jgi:anti-sigma B factor antagonist